MAPEIALPKRDIPRAGHRRTKVDALWRLGAWAGAAVLALAALAIIAQTDAGSERLQLALTSPPEPPRADADAPPRPPEKDAETRALEAQVRALATDRDRLAARLASLERQVDDMTGSIQRQAATPAPVSPATPAPTPAPAPPPAVSAPASLPQIASVAPAAPPTPPAIGPLAMPAATPTGAWPDTAPPKPQAASAAEAKPPAATAQETVPLPPDRLAALPPNEHAAATPPALKYEFGIELAVAPTMEALRGRWAEVKANYGPLLTSMQPVAVHDRRPNGASSYRLIAGPSMNFAAAKQLCTRFVTAGAVCRPVRFDPNNIVQR